MESDVVERDFEIAKKCFDLAAMQGHANAMEELVSLYVEQRLEPSFYYVHRYVSPQPTRRAAAVQDHADAQFHSDPVLNGNIYYYLGT
jgi:TPR repeat protein